MRASLSDDERGAVGAERVAAWILVLLAVGLTVAVVLQPGVVSASPPDASFSGSFDAESNTLTIQHGGGDPIRSGPTNALVVVLDDADSEHSREVAWISDGGEAVASPPVESGDAIVVDDATADGDGDGNAFDGDATVGFELDEGDEATVIWRGRPLGAPDAVSAVLDSVTVSADG